MRRAGRAFSLIELLVVVSIIAVLAALLLGSISIVREGARKTACGSNMRQLGMAILAYAADNDGLLVNAQIKGAANPSWGIGVNSHYNWCDTPLAGGFLDLQGWSGGVARVDENVVLGCPADRRGVVSTIVWSSYGMNLNFAPWINNMGEWTAGTRMLDRYTVKAIRGLVIEANESRWHPGWGSPVEMFMTTAPRNTNIGDPFSQYNWRSFHGGGANILFMDGHVAWHRDPQADARASTIRVK
ncbi:MAG: DUF1559 domain-containing protein [Planctomycetes bacterium]|nr:DUF1559 domain-containing protein [Planctomycetota bacterium]